MSLSWSAYCVPRRGRGVGGPNVFFTIHLFLPSSSDPMQEFAFSVISQVIKKIEKKNSKYEPQLKLFILILPPLYRKGITPSTLLSCSHSVTYLCSYF